MSLNELGILISFDQQSEEKLIQMQNNIYDHGFHGSQTKSIPYHILAKKIPFDKADMIINLMLELEQTQSSFKIKVDKPIIIANGCALALNCQVSQQLKALLKKLRASLDQAQIILLKDNSALITRAYSILDLDFDPFVVTINKLHLYIIDPTQQLLTVELDNK